MLNNVIIDKRWRGYFVDWCERCNCFYIQCDQCNMLSCNGNSCEKCHDDFNEFNKFADHPYKHLTEDEINAVRKFHSLQELIFTFITDHNEKLDLNKADDLGYLSKFDKKIFKRNEK